MSILIESMTKIIRGPYTIRIWREEKEYFSLIEITKELNKEFDTIWFEDIKMSTLSRSLLEIDRVNAVEVLDKDGNGCVFYSNWP